MKSSGNWISNIFTLSKDRAWGAEGGEDEPRTTQGQKEEKGSPRQQRGRSRVSTPGRLPVEENLPSEKQPNSSSLKRQNPSRGNALVLRNASRWLLILSKRNCVSVCSDFVMRPTWELRAKTSVQEIELSVPETVSSYREMQDIPPSPFPLSPPPFTLTPLHPSLMWSDTNREMTLLLHSTVASITQQYLSFSLLLFRHILLPEHFCPDCWTDARLAVKAASLVSSSPRSVGCV